MRLPLKTICAHTAILCILSLLGCGQTVATNPSDDKALPQTEALTPEEKATAFKGTEGNWCDVENATSTVISKKGIKQLEILSVDDRQLTCNIVNTMAAPAYRITGTLEPIVASIDERVASFETKDERGNYVQGTLTIDGDTIRVSIKSTGTHDKSLGSNGSLSMDCTMVRDQHYNDRQAREWNNFYILSESSSRRLTDDDVLYLPSDKLMLARNEIFARHGYIFKTESLASYFNSQLWYEPTIPADEFSSSAILSSTELTNIALIQRWESTSREFALESGFEGVAGTYTYGSDGGHPVALRFSQNDNANSFTMDLLEGDGTTAISTGIPCTVTGDNTASATVDSAGIQLTWDSTMTMTISLVSGSPSDEVRELFGVSWGNGSYFGYPYKN